MSICSRSYSQSGARVLNSMHILEAYTFQTCTNENIFPNEIGLLFALQILDKCLDASAELANAFHTNSIFLDGLLTRRVHQIECSSHLNSLLHLVENAWKTCHISPWRIEYWISLVALTEKNLGIWMISE